MKLKQLALIVAAMAASEGLLAALTPSATWTYAVKDTSELKMDWYAPAPGSAVCFEDGTHKPMILFVFGGGFCAGERSEACYQKYFEEMTKLGYDLVTIDYRLGMKGKKGGANLNYFKVFHRAIHLAVDDLFSAVDYLLKHQAQTGLDARNMVLCGSSAGAITVLQAAWELDLDPHGFPRDFVFKGVMSYSGGIISKVGKPRYSRRHCPVLLYHGTSDKVVEYNKLQIFNKGFFGSKMIASRLKRSGVPFHFVKYDGLSHEVAARMEFTCKEQEEFIRTFVVQGKNLTIETLVDDPSIKRWKLSKTSELYKK